MDIRACPRCGNDVPPSFAFCHACGTQLDRVATPSARVAGPDGPVAVPDGGFDGPVDSAEATITVDPAYLPGGARFVDHSAPDSPTVPRPAAAGTRSAPAVATGSVPAPAPRAAPRTDPAPRTHPTTAPRTDPAPAPHAVPSPGPAPAPSPPSPSPSPSPADERPDSGPVETGEITYSLTGALLGARAAPPRPVPKQRSVPAVVVLVVVLLLVVVAGIVVATAASDTVSELLDGVFND